MADKKSVAIVAMGESHRDYTRAALFASTHQEKLHDEVWGINAVGGVIKCDRVYMMDPVAHFISRYPRYREWLETFQGTVYSCVEHPDFPCVKAYPLQDVVNYVGHAYFSTTIPYAVAHAISEDVGKISLYGCDYSYPDAHMSESGRACLEFHLKDAMNRGIKVEVARSSSLLDTNVSDATALYGYRSLTDRIVTVRHEDGSLVVHTEKVCDTDLT